MTRHMALGEVGTYVNGKAFKPNDWSTEGLPIIRIANLNDVSAPFNYYSGDVGPEHRVDDGDLLVSWSASLDAYLWSRGPAIVNQHIFKVYERRDLVERSYLWYALRSAMRGIRGQVHGATMQHITKPEFESITVPVPSLQEQRQIVTELNRELACAVWAKSLADSQMESARSIRMTVLKEAVLAQSEIGPTRRLGDVVAGRRSPSVATDGDTAVRTATSGCLTPFGFSFDGVRTGRMSERDARDGVIGADEVLVSRSNTEALVGRASRFPGGTDEIVASDLVFRLAPNRTVLDPEYLAVYLSVLQANGYWRDRSSGASSTMKKITKGQLLDVEIRLPPLSEQIRVVDRLHRHLSSIRSLEDSIRAREEAISALPEALLRRIFGSLAA